MAQERQEIACTLALGSAGPAEQGGAVRMLTGALDWAASPGAWLASPAGQSSLSSAGERVVLHQSLSYSSILSSSSSSMA